MLLEAEQSPQATASSEAHRTPPLQSFFLGGFESASHCHGDRCRVDAISASLHDRYCHDDYALLQSAGIRTVRDALRWHRIEPTPGHYDFSTFLSMLEAAHNTGTEVLWDLCHWGVPDWADPFDPAFPGYFQRYTEQAVTVLQDFHQAHGLTAAPAVCPINEISFWSWIGGDRAYFFPHGSGRGQELKHQLVRASNLAIRAMRRICPGLRILQPEPAIFVAPNPELPERAADATGHTAAQFDAWDMLLGRQCPHLGGAEDHLDWIGVNYYWNNQWIDHGAHLPPGHLRHRPLHHLLVEVWERYRKPILISETSAEGDSGPAWLGYIMAEIRQAERLGVPVHGVCLYPVMDYSGWDDGRHCPVGLIQLSPDMHTRTLRPALLHELQLQQHLRTL